MRRFLLLPLPALLGLLALGIGTPTLVGCDGGNVSPCPSDVPFGFEDITPEGTELGATIQSGDCVSVAYVGRLADGGGVFAQGDDFAYVFPSGAPNLARGFILGMAGQKVGETRLITSPPDLAYGAIAIAPAAEGLVGVPSCSVVEFEIRLRAIYQDARQCQ